MVLVELHRLRKFHTVSTPDGYEGLGFASGLNVANEVPPTLVTQGWAGGSSTLGMVVPSLLMHENAPVSPSAPNMLWPCSAICSKTRFSAWTYAALASFSQTAQLELMTSARLSFAIRVYSSSSVCPVKSFGALYTRSCRAAGATASCVSMSASTSMSPE